MLSDFAPNDSFKDSYVNKYTLNLSLQYKLKIIDMKFVIFSI